MTEATELAVVPPKESALEVYSKPSGLDPWLEKIKAEVTGHVPDLITKKGRDHIASLAFKVRKSKTALDALGKQLVDDLKDVPKRIDAERKRVRETLDALAEEVRAPLTDWETAEAERIQAHRQTLDWMESISGGTADELSGAIGHVEQIAMGDMWDEFAALAASTKDKALIRLREALAARQKHDAEQAELTRLREEAAERARQDREAAIAKKAADDAKAEAEAAAKKKQAEAAQKAAADKAAADKREADLKLAEQKAQNEALLAKQAAAQAVIDAEQRIKDAAAAAERKRIADAAEVERAKKAREADKAHKASINRAALVAFVKGGMTEACAKQAVTLIAKGEIPAITISY